MDAAATLISHLFSAGLVWDEIRRLTGDGAFAALGLGVIALLWRAEKAPWFSGRVALLTMAGGLILVGILACLLAWQRVGDGELKLPVRVRGGGAAKPGAAHTPSPGAPAGNPAWNPAGNVENGG